MMDNLPEYVRTMQAQALAEHEALRAENAALRAQLATATRREVEARAVLEIIAQAQPLDLAGTDISLPCTTEDVFYEGPQKAGTIIDAARAWLAAVATAPAGDGGSSAGGASGEDYGDCANIDNIG